MMMMSMNNVEADLMIMNNVEANLQVWYGLSQG